MCCIVWINGDEGDVNMVKICLNSSEVLRFFARIRLVDTSFYDFCNMHNVRYEMSEERVSQNFKIYLLILV